MQTPTLFKTFDLLQKKYGDKNLSAIYGAGATKNAEICLLFMNPTQRNISTQKSWKGLRAPWIGIKSTWKLLYSFGLLEEAIWKEIDAKKPKDWTEAFAEKLYSIIEKKGIYMTNLAKCTQSDARHLPDYVFRAYLPSLHKEISLIRPKVIIAFGGQVSSVLLEKPIKVSECRKQSEILKTTYGEYQVYPVYYPVGQGMRNIKKTKEDLSFILKKHNLM